MNITVETKTRHDLQGTPFETTVALTLDSADARWGVSTLHEVPEMQRHNVLSMLALLQRTIREHTL